jgi:hypothetical protein
MREVQDDIPQTRRLVYWPLPRHAARRPIG